jgi:hypothetical protein
MDFGIRRLVKKGALCSGGQSAGGRGHEQSMHAEADHEEERQVMSRSVRLEALLADFHVGGSVHKDHDESIT